MLTTETISYEVVSVLLPAEKFRYSPINDIYKHMFGVIELRHLKTDRRNTAWQIRA